jgi:hypothetical protein
MTERDEIILKWSCIGCANPDWIKIVDPTSHLRAFVNKSNEPTTLLPEFGTDRFHPFYRPR